MKTVIMAGGMGTRISALYPDIPKPMIPIDGVPVLERTINSLVTQGYNDICITISYKGNKIEDYFRDGSRFGANITYYKEEKSLGNGGALFKIREYLDKDFLLLNADSVFDVDFKRMEKFHKEHNADVTLFVHPNSHPYDSGIIIMDENKSVVNWLSPDAVRPQYYKNRVNAGIHIINPCVLDQTDIDVKRIGELIQGDKLYKIDLDRDLLKPLAGTGKMYCYESSEYVKDMGTPERFKQVEVDLKKGIVQNKNLTMKQKAVFLDRDGTINIYKGFIKRPDDFELQPGIGDFIKWINNAGYLAIVVTNQPVIARGDISYNQLYEIHNKMETLLGLQGAYLDQIYFCPHHPHRGYIGEVSELKMECDCRKPKPGMLIKAANDYNIDLSQSIIIGDSKADIEAGKTVGCTTVLIGEDNWGQNYSVKSVNELMAKIGNILHSK